MAIKKALPTPFGPNTKAEYWRVGKVVEDFLNNSAEVVMYGYASAAERNAGGMPMVQLPYVVKGGAYSEDMSRAKVYNFAKQLSEFSGGEDV